jgi:hypothetical protein
MPSGIKITEIVVGTGAVAEKSKAVLAHVRAFLHRGDECYSTYKKGKPGWIALDKRECIAGLRMGVVGMRVGGKREIIVSPHLAYGEKGVPGSIPPNAVLRFEVELLDVRDSVVARPEDYPPGKQLLVFRPGEAARNLPRWQFGVLEGGVAGAFLTFPIPGQTWRHARTKNVQLNLSTEELRLVFESVYSTQAAHPAECLRDDQMWADASEKANSITRDQATDALCVTVDIYERGTLLLSYGLPETSNVLLSARFYQIITSALSPYLTSTGK